MPTTKIGVEAVSKLADVAKWLLASAEIKSENNRFICVDDSRYAKTRPLLNALGYPPTQVLGTPV